MKLWRRRPLSEDLTDKKLTATNEMPPSLVYISPGIHGISKRSSLVNNTMFSKQQYFSDISSFNSVEKCAMVSNKTNADVCLLQSFKDYNAPIVSFYDDATIQSSRISNKTYLAPVSAEWFPVKDIMKIKRSASVPFQAKPQSVTAPQIIAETTAVNIKTHTSLADKIRTLFRTRSNSRSSKTVLAPINECKPGGKAGLRSSRTRTKETIGCKSMYESSRVNDADFSEKLNHALRDYGKKIRSIAPEDGLPQNTKVQSFNKLNKKKEKCSNEHQKVNKDNKIHWNQPKPIYSKGFSESVVSHTASSAAKCKPSPPRVYTDRKSRTNANCCLNEKQIDKKSITKPNSSNYEYPPSRELSLSITPPNYDRKKNDFHKSDCQKIKPNKIDNSIIIEKREYLSSNQSIPQSRQSDNLDNLDALSSQRPEEDDYVRLAEIDLSLPSQYPFMAQSMHDSIMSELVKSDHEYVNINVRDFPMNDFRFHPTNMTTKYRNSTRNIVYKPPDGQQKKRPISCMAVVESNNCMIINKSDKSSANEQPKNNFPKSPYLSQYTKLYSLKVTDDEIMYAQQSEPSESDVMTRSQTSCPYKTPSIFGKEYGGKRSIDSGLVEDLSMNFRTDSIIKT